MGGILVPGQWKCLGSVLLDLSGILASGLVHLGTALALMLLPYDSPLTGAAGTASPEMLLILSYAWNGDASCVLCKNLLKR